MDTDGLKKKYRVGLAITVASVVFYIVAFASNGWFIGTNDSKTTIRDGLWYTTTCFRSGECKTLSKKESQEKIEPSVYFLVYYSDIVRKQVVATLALCLLIICAVIFAIALCRHKYGRWTRIIILLLSFLAGFLLLNDLGIDVKVVQLNIKHYDTVHFPWSLLMVFCAALSILSAACLCVNLECKTTENQQLEPATQQGSRLLTIVITAVSIACQIGAFSSNAWQVYEYGTTTWYIGLWFLTRCRKDGECKTMSMRKYYEDISDDLDNYSYSMKVRSQSVLTISLLLSIVCLILIVIETRQVYSRRWTRLSIILCSLVSGTFCMYDIGRYMRIYVIYLNDEIDNYTAYFPWSVLIGLFSAIHFLILSFIRSVKECRIGDMNHQNLENLSQMNVFENNGIANVAGILSENNVYSKM